MAKDLWLPRGFVLPDGSKIRLLLHSGEKWQIFDTDGENHILLAHEELAQKWHETGLLGADLFDNIPFGSVSFQSLASPKKYALTAVDGSQPEKAPRAKTFTLPGRPALEAFFNEHVIDIIVHAERYQALGIGFPAPIVLYGPPGCGKTFAVERLVEFLGWPDYAINSNSIGSPYIHETGKKIAEIFDKAIENAPSVIIIDEMESFLSDRRQSGASGLHHMEEVAEFLRRIPEAVKNNVLVIAMTNLIDVIDPAILRRGRFDHLIEVGMPSKEEITSLVDSLLCKLPKESGLSVEPLIEALTGKPLSDAAFVIREAARLAAKAGKTALDQENLITALNSLPENPKKENRRIGFI